MQIIGAGVVDSAAARELARYQLKIGVLEKTPDVCAAVPASAAAPAVLSPIPQLKKHATPLTLVKGRYTMVRIDGQMHTVSPRYEHSPFLKKEFPNMALDVRASQMTEEAYIFAYSLAGAKWGCKPGSHAVMDYDNDIMDHTGYFAFCGARGVIRFNERCTAVCAVR